MPPAISTLVGNRSLNEVTGQENRVKHTSRFGPLHSARLHPNNLSPRGWKDKAHIWKTPLHVGEPSYLQGHLQYLRGSCETETASPSFPLMFLQRAVASRWGSGSPRLCLSSWWRGPEVPGQRGPFIRMGQDGSQPRWHALGRKGVRVASWAQITSGPTWPGGPWVGFVASWAWPGSSSFGKTVLGVIPGNSQEPFCCAPNGFTNIYLPASNSFLFTIRWLLTTIIKLLQKRRKDREGQRRLESSALGQCL